MPKPGIFSGVFALLPATGLVLWKQYRNYEPLTLKRPIGFSTSYIVLTVGEKNKMMWRNVYEELQTHIIFDFPS